MNVLGIDFGAKLAGTTVAAWIEDGVVDWAQSAKKQDADRFLIDLVSRLAPGLIAIDAPLSLPLVYRQAPGQEVAGMTDSPAPDYFYRSCDREVKAMSPMFIGGLTARAMRLRAGWQQAGIQVREAYPKLVALRVLSGQSGYKQKSTDPGDWWAAWGSAFEFPLAAPLENWHQVDAVLALWTGLRIDAGKAVIIGDPNEGTIAF